VNKTFKFQNWAKIYSCKPKYFHKPSNSKEIKEIVEAANSNNEKVKIVGIGHSPNDMSCITDGHMISLEKYNNVISLKDKKVKVESGTTLEDLNKFLVLNKLNLSVIPSVSDLTIGGIISTATHATGLNYGNLSSYVVEIELLTGTGEVLTLSEEENQEIFKAALCGIGTLGIILTATIQCEEGFNLKLNKEIKNFSDLNEDLINDYNKKNGMQFQILTKDHFKIEWFPHADKCALSTFNKTKEKVSPQIQSGYFKNVIILTYLFEFLLFISSYFTFLVPIINSFYFYVIHPKEETFIDESINVTYLF
jgi:UDP-N-acetylenolpyruvoylglucosamine reductase